MKSIIGYTVALNLLAVTFMGCIDEPQPSGMINTSYLWADFSVRENGGSEARAEVTLHQKNWDGAIVTLSDDERIECNDLILDTLGNSVVRYIPVDPNGVYNFIFVRTDDVIHVRVEMPPAPEILGVVPDNRIVRAGDRPTVFWNKTGAQQNVEIGLTGKCIYSVNSMEVPDTGKATFPAVGKGNTDCNLNLSVTRTKTRDVNAPFRGGKIVTTVQRSVTMNYLAGQ